MLIKLVVKIYSLKLVSVYQGYTLIVFMTQGYLTAERLRTTALDRLNTDDCCYFNGGCRDSTIKH